MSPNLKKSEAGAWPKKERGEEGRKTFFVV